MAVCGSKTATQLPRRTAEPRVVGRRWRDLGSSLVGSVCTVIGTASGCRWTVSCTRWGSTTPWAMRRRRWRSRRPPRRCEARSSRPAQLRAERKAAVAQAERESVTLEQWVDQWLEHLRDHGGAESSIVTHRSAMRVHVLPVLGQRRLVDISPEDVDDLIAGVRARPSKRNPKARTNGVAPNVLRTLRACLNVAVKKGLLPVSPVRAEAPARRVRPADPDGDVATPEEVGAMTAAMPEHLRIAIPLAAWCSLRLGEVLGLQRGDLERLDDPDQAVLHVRRQVNAKAPGAPVTPPKADSVRSIAIPSFMLADLIEHLEQHCREERTSPVLAHPRNKTLRISQTTFDRHWRAARAVAGRPTFRFHDLRHTGLTMYAQQGATLAELLHRGGHTDVSVAVRYQHATAERDRALTKRLAAALG
jgi:integrase